MFWQKKVYGWLYAFLLLWCFCSFVKIFIGRHPASLPLLFNHYFHTAELHDLLRWQMIWCWFFILLSAASQYIQGGLRIDPCTPAGYSYNVDSGKFSPGSDSEKSHLQSKVQTRGNFSECRSAALMLLQTGKGCIQLFCIVNCQILF